MSAEPWSKFFWSDYDADEGLRMCSLAAQGLWMRMLCLMARASPKGELRVGGEPCSVSDLSRAVGESEGTVAGLLGELERRGVFSTTRAGVIFSRRLRKDAEISRKRAKSGAKGAAARYGKESENQLCNGKTPAKPLAKASPQKPEARSQSPETKKEEGSGKPPSSYAFEGIVIRLKADQFDRWRKAFPDLSLMAKLQQRDDWLANEADEKLRRKWFIPTSNWLAKEQQKAAAEKKEPIWDGMA